MATICCYAHTLAIKLLEWQITDNDTPDKMSFITATIADTVRISVLVHLKNFERCQNVLNVNAMVTCALNSHLTAIVL